MVGAVQGLRLLSTHERRLAALTALGVLVTIALRACVGALSFTHADLLGASIVDGVLDFPKLGSRASYGQFGFLVEGAVAAVLGRRFEVVAAFNQVASGAALGLSAWLAYRYTRSAFALGAVLAAGALYPPLVRVALSEDLHSLAVLLGLVALWAADVYAERRQPLYLLITTLALVAMIHTRQTLYPWVGCVYLLIAARGGRAVLVAPPTLMSLVVVLGALGLRLSATLTDESDHRSILTAATLLSHLQVVGPLIVHHPLLDVPRFGPAIPLFVLVGTTAALTRPGISRALALSFLAYFVITLPFGYPTPGVELTFRTPTFTLALLTAGVGAASIAPRRTTAVAALILLAGAGTLAPAFASLREVSTDLVEYRFARDAMSWLPRRFVLVVPPSQKPQPSCYNPSYGFFRRDGIEVERVEPDRLGPQHFDRPVLFLQGLFCGGYNLEEVWPSSDVSRRAELVRVLFGHHVDQAIARIPNAMRSTCAQLIQRSRPLGPAGSIARPVHDLPFVIYGLPSITLQFHRLSQP